MVVLFVAGVVMIFYSENYNKIKIIRTTIAKYDALKICAEYKIILKKMIEAYILLHSFLLSFIYPYLLAR